MSSSSDDSLTGEQQPSDIRWLFTRRNLHELRHHVHPIALGRGFSDRMVAERWPGLSFGEAIAFAGKGRAWCNDSSHFAGLGVRERVKEVHVLVDGTIRTIEFTDDEMAARDGDPDRLTSGKRR